RIVPVFGGPVLDPPAEAALVSLPGKEPAEPPAVDLLHPAHVAAAGPPGEAPVEGVQARIGVGQGAFHTAQDPQLTPAQAHDGMLPSGVPGQPPPAGVKRAPGADRPAWPRPPGMDEARPGRVAKSSVPG